MKRLVVLIVPLFISCYPTPHCEGSFRIEHNVGFTEAQEEDIKIAASRWNAFVGREYFHISDDGFCPITRGQDLTYPAIGYYSEGTNELPLIYLSSKYDSIDINYQVLVLHEFGHSLGMQHVSAGDRVDNAHYAVMSAKMTSINFTQLDLNECIRVGICK